MFLTFLFAAPSQEVLQFMQLYSQYYSTEGSNVSSKSVSSFVFTSTVKLTEICNTSGQIG